MMDLAGKRVTIIGSARSGLAAARLAGSLGARVKISEQKDVVNLPEDFARWAEQNTVRWERGGHTQAFIEDSDLVVVSPGVNVQAPPLQWARGRGIPTLGEIEFAYRLCPCPIIAVTGSNGKTTVSTLISLVLRQGGFRVQLCGNIGEPFSQFIPLLKGQDYVVLEVSSFQMETIVDFKPHIAVLLNFSENHLDRHKDLDDYFQAKTRIFLNQDEGDHAVLNGDSGRLRTLGSTLKAKVRYFEPSRHPGMNPNVLAVRTVADILGVPSDITDKVFADFRGVEHRLERVRDYHGIEFINDSKATTAEAGRWALENIRKPILLICGGRDKHIDFSGLKDLVSQKVKKMIVIGEARVKLARTFAGCTALEESDTLAGAIQSALADAQPGDCIVLSPMCASFDMFDNFEHRGRVFKDLVMALP